MVQPCIILIIILFLLYYRNGYIFIRAFELNQFFVDVILKVRAKMLYQCLLSTSLPLLDVGRDSHILAYDAGVGTLYHTVLERF